MAVTSVHRTADVAANGRASRIRPLEQELSLLIADERGNDLDDVVTGLSERGAMVTVCTDGAEALLRIGLDRPDVVLVSAGLPTVGGNRLIQVLRHVDGPSVILGVGAGDAKNAEQALADGANACVARPYRLLELLPILQAARPGSLSEEAEPFSLEVGPIRMDLLAYDVFVRGQRVHLALREFELLRFLLTHPDRVLTREQIAAGVWRSDGNETNTIVVHIRRLRSKLGDDPQDPRIIRTIRGVGYSLVSSGADQVTSSTTASKRVP